METDRTYCPICGHDFYEIPPPDPETKKIPDMSCPSCKQWKGTYEELIGPDDDYAWVL